MRCAGLAGLLWVACVGTAWAWDSPAPDVVLYSTPALEGPLRAAALRYKAANHVEVHVFVAPPDGLVGLVRHRARADVVVADAATVSAMAAQGLVRAESVVVLGLDPFVLIGKAGVRLETDAAALVGTHATVLPDPTTAASFDGAALLHAALPGVAALELQGVADTPDVIVAVRGNGRLLGVVTRTEASVPGVVQAARLAVPPVGMQGALVANGQSRNAAAFLQFVAGPDGRARLRAAGLEDKS